jgi:uncharacterized SAM-binding protein YcdF (DUF218 family)
MSPLENRYPPFPVNPPQLGAVVVLGGGIREDAPDEGGGATLSTEALGRVLYGLRLFRKIGAPIVVSGGRAGNIGGKTEADVAATLLAQLGVPEGSVIREGKSLTTWENAREVAEVLAARKITRVALVTSAYHMPRAMLAFTRAGVVCVAAPTNYLTYGGKMSVADLLPSFAALSTSFSALREYAGIVQYHARR